MWIVGSETSKVCSHAATSLLERSLSYLTYRQYYLASDKISWKTSDLFVNLHWPILLFGLLPLEIFIFKLCNL